MILFEPRLFPDARGGFFEAWQVERYRTAGIGAPFVQDNVSWSHQGVLRGLHIQNPHAQGKLIQTLAGEIWDVAVDLRQGSPTFGEWEAHALSDQNRHQFYIPPGFAHGFLAVRGPALVTYKCTDTYDQASEFTVRFDDPNLAIPWPEADEWLISDKDRQGQFLADISPERLVFG